MHVFKRVLFLDQYPNLKMTDEILFFLSNSIKSSVRDFSFSLSPFDQLLVLSKEDTRGFFTFNTPILKLSLICDSYIMQVISKV